VGGLPRFVGGRGIALMGERAAIFKLQKHESFMRTIPVKYQWSISE
jgi:hypothetical protein